MLLVAYSALTDSVVTIECMLAAFSTSVGQGQCSAQVFKRAGCHLKGAQLTR